MNNILEYLESAVSKNPNKIAFVSENTSLSFGQVQGISQRVGTYLIENNFKAEPIVIFMEKSANTVSAFLGVVASGNYYVPLDSEMPAGRIKLIFNSLKPRMVITDDKTYEVAKTFESEDKIQKFSDVIKTDINIEKLAKVREKALDIDPIYIVFTSGSTGNPKGVLANHRSVIDYVNNLSDVLQVNGDSVFGNQAPLYVDACLKDIFPTLKYCATTYFIPKSCFMFPVKLVDFLNENRINTICWVVSALTMISAFKTFEQKTIKYLHTVAFGSEIFPIKQFNLWREHLPNARFINLYGPTEATGMSTYYVVNREFEETDKIPVGKPFKNTQILLIGENNQLAKQGKTGEICIRGTCLTMGYFNDEEKTRAAFVQNPLVTAYDDLIYKTGDLAKLNEYGELIFLSRKDYQIKHMGHRIELAEIEVCVSTLEEIKMCCCVFDNKTSRLYLYCVTELDQRQIMAELKKLLPRYMLPFKIIILEKMPLTSNGKIDRKNLLDNI